MISVLSNLLVQLPSMAVMVVGLIVAIARWQRHPRVSLLLVVALLAQLLTSFTQPIAQNILIGTGASASELGLYFAILGIVSSIEYAVSLGLILWAAFGWRDTATTTDIH